MKDLHPQYITDDKGNKISVVLSMNEYEDILHRLDELEDIRLYDEVKSRNEESMPFEEYLRQRKKNKRA
jgi:hypothetical protein